MTSQCVGELRSGIKGQPFCNAQSLRSTDQDTALVVFFIFKNVTVNKCEQISAKIKMNTGAFHIEVRNNNTT